MSVFANDRLAGPLACTGGETVLGYDFKIIAASDLAVIRLRNGVEQTLGYAIDYTLTGVGNDGGGTVTLTTPALSGDVYALEGARPNQRLSDLAPTREIGATALNGELDALQIQVQEIARSVQRSVRRSSTATSGEMTIPAGSGVVTIDENGNVDLTAPSILAGANLVTTDAMIASTYSGMVDAAVEAGVTWIETKGRSTPGDGGGTLYGFPTTSLPPHAGYLRVKVGGVNTYFIACGRDVDPLMFGAAGNGVTDDAAKIQDCITAAGLLGLPVRMNREKTYAIGSTIVVPAGVIIENPAQAVWKDTRRVAGFTVQLGTAGVPAHNVKLRGLVLRGDARGNYIPSHMAIYCNATVYGTPTTPYYTNDIEISDCDISGYGQAGIRTDYVTGRYVIGNRVTYCGYQGIVASSVIDDTCHDNEIASIRPGAVGVGTEPNGSSVSSWKSALWAVGTSYTNGDGLFYATADGTGQHYRCTSSHTASSANEPGVGPSWATVWTPITAQAYWIAYGISVSRDLARNTTEAPISQRWSVNGNKVYDVPSQTGIDTHGGQSGQITNNIVIGCHLGVHTEAADWSGGVGYVATAEVVIAHNNIVGDGKGAGVSIDGASVGVNEYGVKVIGNTLRNCGWLSTEGTHASGFGGAIRASKVTSLLISGNTLYVPVQHGIAINDDTRAIIIDNDIVLPVSVGGVAYGIKLLTVTTGAILANNRFRLLSGQTAIDVVNTPMTSPYEIVLGPGNVLDASVGTLLSATALTVTSAATAHQMSSIALAQATASVAVTAPAFYASSSVGAGFLVMQRLQQIASGDIGWWRGYSYDYTTPTMVLKEYVRMLQTITSNTLGAEASDVAIQLRDAGALAEAIRFKGNGDVNIKGTRVIKARETGWTAGTGTANKGAFTTGTATLVNCAERIFAIEQALRNHGLIN